MEPALDLADSDWTDAWALIQSHQPIGQEGAGHISGWEVVCHPAGERRGRATQLLAGNAKTDWPLLQTSSVGPTWTGGSSQPPEDLFDSIIPL